jgi:hypothetical protein
MILVLFLPGFLLLRAIWGKPTFSTLENFVLSFALSIVSVDGLMLLMDRLSIPLTRWSLLCAVGAFAVAFSLIYRKRFPKTGQSTTPPVQRSKRFAMIAAALILLTVIIKTAYLSKTILPTTTDLGHHMYWAQTIVNDHSLPAYEKQDIEEQGGTYRIGEAESISDFVVGEHLIFAAVALVGGSDFVSSHPALLLYLIDLVGILAVFILVLRAFEGSPLGGAVALFALGILGPLFAISPPQAKYVAGGVVGNLIGNLLFPLILYCLIRAFRERRPGFLALGVLFAGGLLYTHHLTTYLFLYAIAFAVLFFIALNIRILGSQLREWRTLLFSRPVLITLACLAVFLFVVYTPSYLTNGAVASVARAPTKTTREGMSFGELVDSIGSARLALGLFGAFLLVTLHQRARYASALLLGWGVSILAILLWPAGLRVDIPTIRIANYFTFPVSILAALTLAWLLALLRADWPARRALFASRLTQLFSVLVLSFLIVSGIRDTAQSMKDFPSSFEAVQTYHASEYLASRTTADDGIVKDHNYLTADSFIKLFFMRGYNYPLTRGYFTRYTDQAERREPCPLWMISSPDSTDGQRCFRETGTDFVMINPKFDARQFIASPAFWNVYSADAISIFYRP